MSHNCVYKIVDFGFAKLIPGNTDIYGTVLGTIITMAPEVMRRQKYGLKADIWSIGIILYEMIYGKLPYDPMKST
jgi:serine/threonine-protein kinase ULK/ATG1